MKWKKMRTFQRVRYSLREQGLWATIVRFYILIIDSYFDIKYGTDTSLQTKLDDLTIESENKERGINYQPSRVIPLRKLYNNIKFIIPADSVFVDFGCGKGRVLLITS